MKRAVLFSFLIIVLWVSAIQAAVTAWISPQTAATVSRTGGNADWTDYNYAKTGDTDFAYTVLAYNTYSHWLRLTNFDFSSVPTGATITGIELHVRRRAASQGSGHKDSAIYLRKTSGQVGNNLAQDNIWDATKQSIYYGGSSNLWGAAWSVSNLNSDFGVDISVLRNSTQYPADAAEVYYVQIRVYYIPAAFKVAGVTSPAKVSGVEDPAKISGVPAKVPTTTTEIYLNDLTKSCNEGDATVTVNVKLTSWPGETVTVNWAAAGTNTYDGAQSAIYGSGADFTSTGGTITFSGGSVSQNITINLNDNTAAEPDQKFTVTLSNPSPNATIQTGKGVCAVTIADNDRHALINMTSLPSSCPIGSCSGWLGSSWNLYNNGTNGTANRTRFQAFLDHFKDSHSGKAIVCYFPAQASTDGIYLINCTYSGGFTSIKIPVVNNKWTFVGAASDGRNDTTEKQAIFKAETPYWVNYNSPATMFYNSTLATYDLSANSEPNRLLFQNLIIDFDNVNCGAYSSLMYKKAAPEQYKTLYLVEQYTPVRMRGSSSGRLDYTFERVKIKRSPTGAHNPGWYSICRMHQFEAEDCVKGFCTLSTQYVDIHAYDIRSGGSDFGGGFWMEGSESGRPWQFRVYGSNWTINQTLHWTIAPYDSGLINVSNITLGKYTNDRWGIPGFYWSSGIGSTYGKPLEFNFFGDTTFYVHNRHKIIYSGEMNYNGADFISYNHPDSRDPDLWPPNSKALATHFTCVPRATIDYLGYGAFITYTDGVFNHDGIKPSGAYAYGFGQDGGVSWDGTNETYYYKFTNCTFGNNLDGALKQAFETVSAGGLTVRFDNCTYNTNNNRPLFDLSNWSDTGRTGRLIINGATIASQIKKIYHIYGYSGSTKQNRCWILHNYNLTKDQAENSITQTSTTGIENICIANAAHNLRISSIPRSTQTTITTIESHGLNNGDKVIFDGFDSTNNLSWFTNLSPHINIPEFTVEKVNDTQFKIKKWNGAAYVYVDSTSYSANYSSSGDIARVSKYPFRIIAGISGDNPVISRPAGLSGDRYVAGSLKYRCTKNGINGVAVWALEDP